MKSKKHRRQSSDDSSSDDIELRSHKAKKRPRDSEYLRHKTKSTERTRTESRRRSADRNQKSSHRHRSNESRRRSRSPSKEEERRHHKRKHSKHTSSSQKVKLPYKKIEIKKEEDFDRRQEELRRKRRREGNHHTEYAVSNTQVKEEPDSDNDRRTTTHSQDNRRGHQRSREDDDEERRHNEERRREEWGKRESEGGGNAEALAAAEPPKEKEKPNLGLSGALTEDTNSYKGVVIKYNEPPEARIPKKKWRLYPFKGDDALKVLHLHRQSAYLLGRLRRIVDIPIDHPSCSKQHAVFQFRLVEETRDGRKRKIVKPYIIDLESGNGTFVNNVKIEPRRYVELKEQDIIKFGFSSREYVLLHDKSDTTEVHSEESEENDTD